MVCGIKCRLIGVMRVFFHLYTDDIAAVVYMYIHADTQNERRLHEYRLNRMHRVAFSCTYIHTHIHTEFIITKRCLY